MTKSRGVLTIAHGDRRYASQAVTMARAIRLRDPHLPIAVATDLPPALFEGAFDYVVPWTFDLWTGWLAKFDSLAMSPFDETIYLDADVLMFHSLEPVFRYFAGRQFGVIGDNRDRVVWFRSMDVVRSVVPSDTYPSFNGGLYYFERCALVDSVFAEAKALHARYDELQIKRNRRMDDDQALISLVMARYGLRASSPEIDGMLFEPIWPNGARVYTDVIAGECGQLIEGRRIRRGMLHYYGDARSSYNYVREAMRLRAAFANPRHEVRFDGLIRLRALVTWLRTPPRGLNKLRAPIANRINALRRASRSSRSGEGVG